MPSFLNTLFICLFTLLYFINTPTTPMLFKINRTSPWIFVTTFKGDFTSLKREKKLDTIPKKNEYSQNIPPIRKYGTDMDTTNVKVQKLIVFMNYHKSLWLAQYFFIFCPLRKQFNTTTKVKKNCCFFSLLLKCFESRKIHSHLHLLV